MKIAVVFFGKFTGVNNRGKIQDFETPYNYLKSNVLTENTDIFFHGWNDDDEQSRKLVELFKPKKFLLENQIVFDHPFQHYNFIPYGPWNTKDYLNNNYSRFYSIKKSLELVDEQYDLVLLSRFDTIFLEPLPFNEMSKDQFYVSDWVHNSDGMGFQDAWFVSGIENMKKFSLIFDRMDDYMDLNGDYLQFIKKNGGDEKNITSGHAICRYRIVELGLEEHTYCVGSLPETWTLSRYLNGQSNITNKITTIKKLK